MLITLENLEKFFNIKNVHESDYAVFGRKGRGKTLFCVLEAYLHYIEDGLTVYSNMKLNFPFIYNPHMIFDYEELQNAVILIDESKACANAFNLVIQIVIKGRKNNVYFYFTAQKKTFVITDIRDQCVQVFPRFNEKTRELSIMRIAIDEFGGKEIKLKTIIINPALFELFDTTESPPILTLEDKLIAVMKKSGCSASKRIKEEKLQREYQLSRERFKINLEINYGDKKERKQILKDYDAGKLDYLIADESNDDNHSTQKDVFQVKGYQLELLNQEHVIDEGFYNVIIETLGSCFTNRNITMTFNQYINGDEKEVIAKHYGFKLDTVESYISKCFNKLNNSGSRSTPSISEKLYFNYLKRDKGYSVQHSKYKGVHVDFINHSTKQVISFKCYFDKNFKHALGEIAKSEIEVALKKKFKLVLTCYVLQEKRFYHYTFSVSSVPSRSGVEKSN